jgi:hypothetical protein
MVSQIIRQIFFLIFISCTIGFILQSFGVNIYIGVIAGIIMQYVIYNVFVYILKVYEKTKLQKLEVEKLKQMAYQGTEVTCPCKHKQFAFIRLNTSNYYKCEKCKKTVSVFVSTETAIVTEPIADTNISSIDNMLQEKLNELTR